MLVQLSKLIQLVCNRYFNKILSLCFVCLFAFPLSDFPLVAFHFRNHSVQYAVEVWVVSLLLEPTRVLGRLGCEAGTAGGKLSFWWSHSPRQLL